MVPGLWPPAIRPSCFPSSISLDLPTSGSIRVATTFITTGAIRMARGGANRCRRRPASAENGRSHVLPRCIRRGSDLLWGHTHCERGRGLADRLLHGGCTPVAAAQGIGDVLPAAI